MNMAFSHWKNLRLMANATGRGAVRRYGTTTKGEPTRMALAPRGLQPAPPVNWALVGVAGAGLVLAGSFHWYVYWRRGEIKHRLYDQIISSDYAPWKDFNNKRFPKLGKVLANDSPCGDSFKEAYLCAVFGENCDSKFSSFLSCVNDNPTMMRSIRPDGKYNWKSKLFLHNLLHERNAFEDLVASVGPAEENMEDVYDSYRARELLGANASEAEVNAFKQKFSTLKDEFYSEVKALLNEEKSDSSRADKLLKQLRKDYSVPSAVWLQVMKDYDLEEFDDSVTFGRQVYGNLIRVLKKFKKLDNARDADFSKVACGEQFDKMYQCMENREFANNCVDFMDELFFCREHHYKEVWPKVKNMDVGDFRKYGSDVFLTPAVSFRNEMDRVQELTGQPGLHE